VTLPNAAWVEAQLANAGHTIKVHAFDALGSTNVWLAENDISAGVCITDHQQAGHGRRGRSWQSLPGNITVSIAQRVPIPMHESVQKESGLRIIGGIGVNLVQDEQVKDREQDCDGVACGVDDSGALQVRVSASRTMSVHAGDVTVRRRPGQQ